MKNEVRIMKPLKLRAAKNWLWLWILPTALSLLLLSLGSPTGGAAFWIDLGIIGSCSCLCSFALAFKSFSTFQERIWGGLFFMGGSLCVISSILFIGCFGPSGPPAADMRKWRIQHKAWVAQQIVPRDAQADATMLDLTSFYDTLLPDQTYRLPSGFHALEPGTHTWEGIKFDVRGVVEPQNQPDGKLVGVPVGRKCSEIAFLHGGIYGHEQTNIISRFVVRYANGHAETIPIVCGKDVSIRHFRRDALEINPPLTNSVVWEERMFSDGTPRPVLMFFIKKWNNPFPQETVATIDFVKTRVFADPFVVAITVFPVNP
jgi:hypothetical protein